MDKIYNSIKLISVVFLLFFSISCLAQKKNNKVNKKELSTIIHKIADSLEYYYVNLDDGKKIGNLLEENYKQGNYNKLKKPEELAKQLTSDLRVVNGDKHLSVTFRPINKTSNYKSNIEKIHKSGIWNNYGFQEVQILDGNIGYVKIANFSNWDNLYEAKKAASATMEMVSNTDAIIFDVRNNRGGVPYLVSHLASYLFEGERVHLTQYVHRFNNGGYGIYTEPNVLGRKRQDVPLYILVNSKTASAGEEFAFWLKNLKRASVIGEVTMGAGYGAMNHRLNDRFIISISSEEEVNPITKTGFEQIGVIPNIKTTSDNALGKAKELAKISSQKYRKKTAIENKKLLEFLNFTLKDDVLSSPADSILKILMKCKKARILDERKINRLGYDYATKYNKPKAAEYIFKANTVLYSESANVYDSYAELLAMNNKLSEALSNYKKAVDIAKKTKAPNLNYFIENVKKTENTITQISGSNYKKIQINDKLQDILKDSFNRKVIKYLDTLFLQIENGNISDELIQAKNTDLTIAVFKGLQGIKSFDNSTENLNNYEKQLAKFYTISENTYSISVSLISKGNKIDSPFLKTMFRLIAKNKNGKIKFSLPINYITNKWKSTKVGNITYFYKDTIQLKRARKFDKKNTIISKKLNVPTEQFKFYMCDNYQEILNLLGYEYQLESSTTTRLGYGVEEGYIFSIMNNEDFSHDVFHYYSDKINKQENRNWITEEGIACSWGNAYYTDKNGEMIELNQLILKLKKYLKDNKNADLFNLFKNDTKIFNNIASELSVRSVISGIICNEVESQKGIDGIIKIINSGRIPNSMDAYFKTLNDLMDIHKGNFNTKVSDLLEKY